MEKYQVKTKKYYAKWAKKYPIVLSPWRVQLLNKFNLPIKKVLDIGCGTGNYLLTLPNHKISGIDFSKESIEVLKARDEFDSKRMEAVVGDIIHMPFLDNEFDLAYSFSTLYYINEIDEAMKEICRVLKKKGIGIFEFGNIHSVNSWYDRFMFSDCPQFHWSKGALIKMINDAGFKVREILYRQLIPDFFKMFDKKFIKNKLFQKVAFRLIFVVEKK